MVILALTRKFVAVICDRNLENRRDTMAKKVRAKRGRPKLPARERKLASVAFRPAPHLRERLEKEATAHRVPLSREIEERLSNSFQAQEAFGGPAQHSLMQLLALATSYVETVTGKKWIEDFGTFQQMQEAWHQILQVFAPAKPPDWDEKHTPHPPVGTPMLGGPIKHEWEPLPRIGRDIGQGIVELVRRAVSEQARAKKQE